MKIEVGAFKACAVGLGVGAMVLMSTSVIRAADVESKVEVSISDKGYDVKGQTTPGALTAIVVRNQGSMTHGISSPLFKTGVVKKEGDVVW